MDRLLRVVLISTVALACSDAPPQPVAGTELRTRVEAKLATEREALRESFGHYALVYEVSQEELHHFMAQILLRRGEGGDTVPGSVHGLELHGGAVLGLLLDYWRPSSRRPELSDRYPFSWARSPVALAQLYDSHRKQIFLPVPGSTQPIDAILPASPQLARMRFRTRSATGATETSERDSFAFLGALLAHEPDLGTPWSNHLNQRLSAHLLLRNAWDHYLEGSSAEVEATDPSYLHLVEVLLAYSRHPDVALEPSAIKERFLSRELRRRKFGGYEPSEALGHYADSLGFLLEDRRIGWRADERQQVREWLDYLENDPFRTLDGLPLAHLTHLLRGLRTLDRSW